MRVAISNIAWDVHEDEAIGALLEKYHVDAFDIAPGILFPEPDNATDEDIAAVKSYWQKKGVEITGMQALLFGTQGLNVFGTQQAQQALLAHLASVCRIASKLGARRLVFGSPKNRDRSGLINEEALEVAVSFFRKLGDLAAETDVFFCLEPNPTCYGANFMVDSHETHQVVRAINHPAIKMQLDTGALTINKESIQTVLDEAQNNIGHIHISEPGLKVVGDEQSDHQAFAAAIHRTFDAPLITIEMVATPNEPQTDSVKRALNFVTTTYRNAQ